MIEQQEPPSHAEAPSIARLPFVAINSDPDSDHFADGLSAELLNKLAAIRGLKVIGQTSSFYFKGKQEPLPTIAKTLKVNHILEGSVQRSGATLRITASLVDGRDGSQLWSRKFDRGFGDVFRFRKTSQRLWQQPCRCGCWIQTHSACALEAHQMPRRIGSM